MSFDVYAGTLTRYFTDDWENVVQRQARLDGMQYQRITPGGHQEPPPAAEVFEAVQAWCEAITNALGANIESPISWDESTERPYFTDRPGWPGYTGLLLWAAYAHSTDLSRPRELPDSWDNDPAFVAALPKDSGTPYRQIIQPSLWLPCHFNFTFKAPDVTGDETWIGSTFALRDQLELLNEKTFGATDDQLSSYLTADFAATDEVEHAAKFTLAVFLTLSREACAHSLPMTLSF